MVFNEHEIKCILNDQGNERSRMRAVKSQVMNACIQGCGGFEFNALRKFHEPNIHKLKTI